MPYINDLGKPWVYKCHILTLGKHDKCHILTLGKHDKCHILTLGKHDKCHILTLGKHDKCHILTLGKHDKCHILTLGKHDKCHILTLGKHGKCHILTLGKHDNIPDKCHILTLGKLDNVHILTLGKLDNIRHAHRYAICDNEMEHVFEEKDLGVTIDYELRFEVHISKKVQVANEIVGLIQRSFSFLNCVSFETIYTAFVRPHLVYAQSVWASQIWLGT